MASKSKPLNEQTVEQLTKKKASLKGILMVMGAVVVLYIAYFIYLMVSGTFESDEHIGMMVPLIAVFATGAPVWSLISKINKELQSRQGTQ